MKNLTLILLRNYGKTITALLIFFLIAGYNIDKNDWIDQINILRAEIKSKDTEIKRLIGILNEYEPWIDQINTLRAEGELKDIEIKRLTRRLIEYEQEDNNKGEDVKGDASHSLKQYPTNDDNLFKKYKSAINNDQ